MNKEQLITKQQLEIESLKETISMYKEDAEAIDSILYCVWWPLNDNVLWFTKDQLKVFFRINNANDVYEEEV